MVQAAPLLSVPGTPAPAGGAAEWIVGSGGVRLRAALFPAADPRGSVVLSPGRTEAIEKYYEVVEELRSRGFSVLVHDWRGQGLSQRLTGDPLKGHGGGWRDYVEDHRLLLGAFEARLPRPWIAMGHSMGGGLAALVLAEGETRFAAAALSAPMLGIKLGGRPAAFVRALAWVMSRAGQAAAYAAGAGDPLGGPFEINGLTHDRRRWERTRALLEAHPELQLGGVTWRWLELALAISARLAAVPAERIAAPLTIVAAEDERLVDNAAARAFAGRIRGARYVEVPGAMHEILMETDDRRAVFWTEFDRLTSALQA